MVYLFAICAILVGAFKNFFIISFLIIVHELGHFLTAKLLKVEVDKIYIYPLGGITKLNMPLNINYLKEFLILIMGPLFQVLGSFILISFIPLEKNLINTYNEGILFFNLLPIYPLDGGKIVNIFLNTFIPYKLSLKLCIYLGYIIVISIIFVQKNLTINLLIMICLILFLITKEKRRINYLYHKFILERYLNNYSFSKSRLIKDSNNFYRNCRHIIQENGKYYLEKEYLDKKMQKSAKNR